MITIGIEPSDQSYSDLEPLYLQHYAEMSARLREQGVKYVSPFKPQLEVYFKANREGVLLGFVMRKDGEPIGYANIYLTMDMHNSDLIATEDTIYMLPKYRIGLGRKLADFVHNELRRRTVKRMNVTTTTDPRAGKWLQRQGYKFTGQCMTIDL